jgi:hypothetical protein
LTHCNFPKAASSQAYALLNCPCISTTSTRNCSDPLSPIYRIRPRSNHVTHHFVPTLKYHLRYPTVNAVSSKSTISRCVAVRIGGDALVLHRSLAVESGHGWMPRMKKKENQKPRSWMTFRSLIVRRKRGSKDIPPFVEGSHQKRLRRNFRKRTVWLTHPHQMNNLRRAYILRHLRERSINWLRMDGYKLILSTPAEKYW